MGSASSRVHPNRRGKARFGGKVPEKAAGDFGVGIEHTGKKGPPNRRTGRVRRTKNIGILTEPVPFVRTMTRAEFDKLNKTGREFELIEYNSNFVSFWDRRGPDTGKGRRKTDK